MRRSIVPLLALAGIGAADAPALPGWMAGCWEQVGGDRWTEECWMAPRGGMMLGSGRSGRGAAVREWEATQIVAERDGRLVYWASPGGAARIAFPMASRTADEIVFANPAHDYPQRIRYWRQGAMLGAETSLADGGRPARWMYRRVRQ